MKSVVELIGNTPVVEIGSVSGNRLYAKLEYMNPTGSIKDRAAYYMVKEAIARGELARGGAIVEPTSGNTGIGLAMVCRAYGIGCTIVMPANMSRDVFLSNRVYPNPYNRKALMRLNIRPEIQKLMYESLMR